jgi:hypothetical protein
MTCVAAQIATCAMLAFRSRYAHASTAPTPQSMDRRYGIVDLTDIQIVREMMSKRHAQHEPGRKRQSLPSLL